MDVPSSCFYNSLKYVWLSDCVWGAQVIGREELCVRPAFCPELQLCSAVGKISGLWNCLWQHPTPKGSRKARYSSSSSSIIITHFLPHLKQTLTELGLDNNEIGQQGAQNIADALKTNQVVILFLFLSHAFYLISHRSLPYSPSTTMKLDSKELNTLLMLWKLIK
jgi:hypothetical protein